MSARILGAAVALVAAVSCGERAPASSASGSAALLHPTEGAAAPDSFQVDFETSKGHVVIDVHRAWSPRGADRFYYLARNHFYDGDRFFRVVPGFVVQWGINGDPDVTRAWHDREIQDDSVRHSNVRGTITFATSGPNTRTTQLFINLADNARLDAMGFSPFGTVVRGMNVVDSLTAEYGEDPNQDMIEQQGNAYLARVFPRLDSIVSTRVTP